MLPTVNAGGRALLITAITALGAASAGCASLLGLEDTELRDDGGTGGDGGSGALTVSVPSMSARVVRGGDTQEIAVEITRGDGFAGAVTIDATGLPTGVTAAPIELAAGQTEGALPVTAAVDGTLGPIAIQVVASAVDDTEVSDATDVALMVADLPGTLDTTFNNDGISTLILAGTSDRIDAMVLQSTGRIVVLVASGANFSLAAFTPEGSLDTTFGTAGTTAITGITTVKDLALRANDKLVVVGITSTQLSLRGFNADGSLDDVFGTAGTTTLPGASFSASDGESVAVAADGRIYAGGDINNVAGFPTVFRFAASGALEDHEVLAIANPPNTIAAISIRDDGNIMLGGGSGHSPAQFFFARVTPELALDPSFDVDGFRTIPGGGGTPCNINALARGPNGQIAAAGRSQGGLGRSEMFMLDTDGTTVYSSSDEYGGSPEFRGQAVGVQADGKVIVAVEGFGSINTSGVAVARFDTAGAADTTFAGTGALEFIAPVQADPDRLLRALAIQPDGRILAGGNLSNGGLFLIRVWD